MVISAAREADAVRRAAARGVVNYLLKPFCREDLRERLRTMSVLPALDAEVAAEQQDINRVFRGVGAGGRRPAKARSAPRPRTSSSRRCEERAGTSPPRRAPSSSASPGSPP